MEMNHSNPSDKINVFDSLFTTNHIQMLKILLSYIQPPMQGRLAIYVRFLELTYTMRFFTQNPYAGWSAAGLSLFASPAPDAAPISGTAFSGLLDELLPFCDFEDRERLQSLKNTMQNIQNIQETMEMFDMLRDIAPEFFSQNNPDSSAENASGASDTPFGINWSDFSQMMDMIQQFRDGSN